MKGDDIPQKYHCVWIRYVKDITDMTKIVITRILTEDYVSSMCDDACCIMYEFHTKTQCSISKELS